MNGEFGEQLSHSSNNFFFNGQQLNLLSYIWAINIQLLIFKKVVRIIQKLYKSYAKNITLKKKKCLLDHTNWPYGTPC